MIHEIYPIFRMDVTGGNVTLLGPVRIAGYGVEAIGENATLKFYLNSVSPANQKWPEEHILGDGTKGVNFIGDLGTDRDDGKIIIVPGGGTSVFYIRAHFKTRIAKVASDILIIANGDDLHHRNIPDALFDTSPLFIGRSTFIIFDMSLRFVNIPYPQGSLVSKAHITFTATSTQADGSPLARIETDDLDTDPQIADDTAWHARIGSVMAASVPWALPDTVSGQTYQTPDISTVLQAKFDRTGWKQDNDINLYFFEDGGTAGTGDFRNWDASPLAGRAVLHIEAGAPV